MANDDPFDKKKIIAALKAQGISDKEIEKLYGPLPKKPEPVINSIKNKEYQKKNAWKYDNKHKRPVREEDVNPDYEPIEELRKKTTNTKKLRISRKKKPKKPKPVKNDWNTASETRLKALYEAGYSTDEMAAEFKTTNDAITGKLSRLKKAGWKGTIGTTHNPIPSPSGTSSPQAANRKLSPGMKRFLANALEVNFGVAGRFFAKKWGLYEDKKHGKTGGGGSADVTAAVIKSNEMVVTALTRLDTALRRGTSTLTKSISIATSKMTDAINNVTELVRKNQNAEIVNNSAPTGKPQSGSGNGGGVARGIAALLGGVGISMLLNDDHTEANINPNDNVEPDAKPQTTPKSSSASEPTPEIDIKVKELIFEAEDITFEADEFKFSDKNAKSSSSKTPDKKVPTGGPSSGFLNDTFDKLRGGAGGAGFFNGLADKLIGGRGGGGYAGGGGLDGNGGADSGGGSSGSSGGGSGRAGSGSGGGGLIPSDEELEAKKKAWWSGGGAKKNNENKKDNVDGGDKQSSGSSAGSNDGSSIQRAKAAAKEQLRQEGVPEANLDAAASHLVGQALSESGLNPTLSHDHGTGYGIYGARLDRRTNMLDWLKQNNFSHDSLEGQTKAMAHEAMTKYKPTRDALMGATKDNFADTAKTITHDFERPAVENWQDRSGNAQKAFNTPEATNSRALQPPTDIDKNPAIKIKPDAFTNGASPVSPWTKDPALQSMDGSDVVDAARVNQENNTGKILNDQQKEKDDSTNNIPDSPSFDDRFSGDKRSDLSGGDSFQTTMLETEGPNHFSDYPMSDQGVGA